MNRVCVGKVYRWQALQSVSVRSQGIDYRWLSNVGWRIEKGEWWPVQNKLKETGDTDGS
jgi:hypothetical protein